MHRAIATWTYSLLVVALGAWPRLSPCAPLQADTSASTLVIRASKAGLLSAIAHDHQFAPARWQPRWTSTRGIRRRSRVDVRLDAPRCTTRSRASRRRFATTSIARPPGRRSSTPSASPRSGFHGESASARIEGAEAPGRAARNAVAPRHDAAARRPVPRPRGSVRVPRRGQRSLPPDGLRDPRRSRRPEEASASMTRSRWTSTSCSSRRHDRAEPDSTRGAVRPGGPRPPNRKRPLVELGPRPTTSLTCATTTGSVSARDGRARSWRGRRPDHADPERRKTRSPLLGFGRFYFGPVAP